MSNILYKLHPIFQSIKHLSGWFERGGPHVPYCQLGKTCVCELSNDWMDA